MKKNKWIEPIQNTRRQRRLMVRINCCALRCSFVTKEPHRERWICEQIDKGWECDWVDWRVRCTRGVCLFGRCQSLLILIFPFPVSTGPSSPRRHTHCIHSVVARDSSDFSRGFLRFSVNCFQFVRVLFNVSSVHWRVYLPLLLSRCFCF